MFCPNCGSEENQNTQYCRSCGSDLHVIRSVIEQPGSEASSSAAAKVEIGRAFAKQIEAARSAKELKKVTEKVLPDITKFLETPEEKRLRRIRQGSIAAFVGIGAAIGFFLAAIFADQDLIVLSAFGFVTFFVGIALTINGYFFTLPEGRIQQGSPVNTGELRGQNTNELLMPASARREFGSVTEHTTRTLDEKLPAEKNRSD